MYKYPILCTKRPDYYSCTNKISNETCLHKKDELLDIGRQTSRKAVKWSWIQSAVNLYGFSALFRTLKFRAPVKRNAEKFIHYNAIRFLCHVIVLKTQQLLFYSLSC